MVSRKEWDRMAGFGNEYKLEEKKLGEKER